MQAGGTRVRLLEKLEGVRGGGRPLRHGWDCTPPYRARPGPRLPKRSTRTANTRSISGVFKDANDPAKQLQDLDAWTQKFPDSDYKDDRNYLYVLAYQKVAPPQPAKVLEDGAQLMSKDLNAIYAAPRLPNSSPACPSSCRDDYACIRWPSMPPHCRTPRRISCRSATRPRTNSWNCRPKYFTPENKPANQTDAVWTATRTEVESKAKTAMIAIALKPGLAAQAKKDCPGQVSAFSKALSDYPDSGAVAYQLGVALITCERTNPEKVSQALWEIARAVVARSRQERPGSQRPSRNRSISEKGVQQRSRWRRRLGPAAPTGGRFPHPSGRLQDQDGH